MKHKINRAIEASASRRFAPNEIRAVPEIPRANWWVAFTGKFRQS
jgi:hypothetical protein